MKQERFFGSIQSPVVSDEWSHNSADFTEPFDAPVTRCLSVVSQCCRSTKFPRAEIIIAQSLSVFRFYFCVSSKESKLNWVTRENIIIYEIYKYIYMSELSGYDILLKQKKRIMYGLCGMQKKASKCKYILPVQRIAF